MGRYTIRIPEELDEWIQEQTGPHTSKADVIRSAIREKRDSGDERHRGGDNSGDDPVTDVTGDVAALRDRLDELTERVARLERERGAAVVERSDTTDERARGAHGPESGGGQSDRADIEQRMETVLSELEVPGRKSKVERNRREAIRSAWRYLRTHGTANSREIANTVFGEFFDRKIGYSTNKRYPGYGLWDNCVRDRLKQLPGVEAPAERGSTWRFVDWQ